jgi:hypothetical protein
MKRFTHTEVQTGACVALHAAMETNVAHEIRQVGDDMKITTVVEKDVEGTVLAVSYPDGGIDYYPTEITEEERQLRIASQISQLGERIIRGDELDANILTAEE